MNAKLTPRRYDLDWLRVLAFGGVFFYHCARFFNSSDWHIKNAVTSPVVDIFTSIFEMWGMPLLFAISGASIFFALRPGRALYFLRERLWRLLAPLVVLGMFVLGPPQIYVERVTHGAFRGSFLQFLPRYFNGNFLNGDFAWTGVHLWYLEYLFLFTLVLMPLFVWLGRPAGQRAIARLSQFTARPGAIFLWVLPCVAIICLADPFGVLRPGTTEAAGRLIYIMFPVLGYLIFADPNIQQAIIRQRRAALILALVLTPAIPLITVAIEQLGWVITAPTFVLIMMIGGALIWSCLLACFGYGMRYLTANRPLLAYANEAVLPFYVLHQPVILLVGYFVVQLALPIAVKYLVIAALAFGLTLGLYEYGVRRVHVLRPFFGLKTRRQGVAASAPTSPAPQPAGPAHPPVRQ